MDSRQRLVADASLEMFRSLADAMIGVAEWEWVGPHMSQRMFGITRERAEGYVKAHGGTARQLPGRAAV